MDCVRVVIGCKEKASVFAFFKDVFDYFEDKDIVILRYCETHWKELTAKNPLFNKRATYITEEKYKKYMVMK